jgi:hypothetical protein
VVLGMLICTMLTLVVLPGVLRVSLAGYRPPEPVKPMEPMPANEPGLGHAATV